MNLLERFFPSQRGGSKEDAKSRLKVLLVHDQHLLHDCVTHVSHLA